MVAAHAKRKKTADMPDSPPKRVTRARAAKVTDNEDAKPKTTKIATASAKVAIAKKKAAVSVKAGKRKTRADDEDVEVIEKPMAEEPVIEEQPEAKAPKTKGRSKKGMEAVKEFKLVDAPKTRGRQPRAPAVRSTNPEAPKTRGRPRKATESAADVSEPAAQTGEPVKKSTRERAAATTTSAPKSTTAPNQKRVKFEEGDKENIPIETAGPKKSAMKPTGLKAKPVRKPAVPRAATRGRKAAQAPTKTAKDSEKNEMMPLSPKKVHQIAKSDPISEDELAGEKTPIRSLSKSPTKRPMSPIKDIGRVSKLNFNQHAAPSSPVKAMPSSILASPARRPPPSPFKDALKSSPKKIDLEDSIGQPILLSLRTPMKASLLQESPKRGVLADSTMRPILISSTSPVKASLFQSPARRPAASPMKLTTRRSPEKIGAMRAAIDATASPSQSSPAKALIFSPKMAISSPLEAARFPAQRFEVHTSTDEEREADMTKGDKSFSQPTRHNEQDETTGIVTFPHETEIANECSVESDDPVAMDQPKAIEDENTAADSIEAPTIYVAPAFSMASSAFRRISIESESSEDELASPQKICEVTPLRQNGISTKEFGTPAVIESQGAVQKSNVNLSFTPLADQLNSWNASSPNKQSAAKRSRQTRGVFSLGGADISSAFEHAVPQVPNEFPVKYSFFDDEMAIRDDQEDVSCAAVAVESERDLTALQISQESQASDEYGDENVVPAEAELLRAEQEADRTLTCTPAKVFTPARVIQRPREMHTVSKVPLRPSAEDSPVKAPRQRSRSLGGPLATVSQPETIHDVGLVCEQPATPVIAPVLASHTPSSCMRLDAETPGRTVRKGVIPNVLKGAVVYVDVHTTEGADASGIFVDLLSQMGARCVKQWNWNPRASMGSSLDSAASPQEASPDLLASKIGITHVVYKDGGKRTLEKVRSSNGVVLCVGVGWVLDCEREDKWLDEADYTIDTSIAPRGGGRRRKSMEPRALGNLNGNLVPATNGSETPSKTATDVDISPTKEFLTVNSPASRRETFVIESVQTQVEVDIPAPATPIAMSVDDDVLEDGSAWGSPTTPYYLSKNPELVQRTCPPKQMAAAGGLFPLSGNVEDQPHETVRRRLLEARRKSLQWSSRIRSPLGRTVSYGK